MLCDGLLFWLVCMSMYSMLCRINENCLNCENYPKFSAAFGVAVGEY